VSPPNRRSSTVELYLLRHAHAGDPEGWTGDDAARPLSAKGEGQAERLGAFLGSIGFRPDAIASSPKLRARQTAEIVAGHLGVEVRLEERLAGAFDATAVDAILADLGAPARPVLVGHDPDFSDLLAWLVRADGLTMKKGAFARVDVQGPVASGDGSLRWLLPPDLLEGRRT
jgi:phosphohistidine phosphatase SixA